MTREHEDMTVLKKETNLGNKINLAQLAALVFQGAVLVWGASALNSSVNNQQKQIDSLTLQQSALAQSQQALDSRTAEMKGVLTYQTKVLDNINDAIMRRK